MHSLSVRSACEFGVFRFGGFGGRLGPLWRQAVLGSMYTLKIYRGVLPCVRCHGQAGLVGGINRPTARNAATDLGDLKSGKVLLAAKNNI